ncbi:MAG: hypothetical protein WA962_13030 [Ornithinimicrobium sp.]
MPSNRTSTPPARRFAVTTTALAAAFALSACQLNSPVQTNDPYDPADGVSAETDDMEVLDLVVISEGNGAPGVISGYVVNTSSEPLTVQVALEADGARTELTPSVEVSRSQGVRMDGKTDDGEFVDPVRADSVPGVPGGMVSLRLSTADSAVSTLVPVLPPDGVYEPYAEVVGETR